jgi:apolipoprotein D and lipocalin family protein
MRQRGHPEVAFEKIDTSSEGRLNIVKKTLMLLIGVGVAISHAASCSSPAFPPINGFVLEKFLGNWYEIARMPSSFEKDLVNVTATYELRKDGKVTVINQGFNKKKGKKHLARGKGKFAGSPDIGHLRVSFFGPFYADYIIIALDAASYAYAMVASNSAKYLWILSRTPKLEKGVLDNLLAKARELGFNEKNLVMVEQE